MHISMYLRKETAYSYNVATFYLMSRGNKIARQTFSVMLIGTRPIIRLQIIVDKQIQTNNEIPTCSPCCKSEANNLPIGKNMNQLEQAHGPNPWQEKACDRLGSFQHSLPFS